jgi:uncharacterized protein YbjT (DUF2867 family)
MSRTILVTGATGQQGSAVVSALSALPSSPFNILALTRDPTSSRAKALVSSHPDVQIIAGNLDDPEAIFASHGKPIWGVFSVQIFLGGGASIASEERQGRALVDAALANDVKYFVYTSGDRHGKDSEHDDTPVPHLASKARLERYLKAKVDEGHGQMQYTILRPVFFMENIADDFVGKTTLTAWKLRVGANKLQVVSTIDVGVFAAKAFANPEKYSGKAISLAGDELSFEEANNIWRGQKGKCLPTTLGNIYY